MSIKSTKHIKWQKTFLVIALMSVGVVTALGTTTWYANFTATYSWVAGTKLASCGVCHINPAGGGARNSYGTAYANAGHSFAAIESLDSDNDGFTNLQEITALTWPGDSTDHPVTGTPDSTPPTVTAFTISPTSSSLIVAITQLSATDNTGVAGYYVTESTTAPLAGATGWTSSPPASYTFSSAGAKTLRAFAKDGAGNVSAGASASTTITLSDTVSPTVTSFSITPNSNSLTVSVTLSATDNVGVTGYFITESTTPPLAGASGWTVSPPSNYTFATTGTKILSAYAKDGAGNVSAGVSASTTIAFTTTSVKNVIAAHNRTSPQYNRSCTNCHMQVVYEQSLDEPAIHATHLTMAPYVPGRNANAKCTFCHRTVDLLQGSAGNVRRQVDVALCDVCHGTSRPTIATKLFYQKGPSLTNPDGAALYTLICSGCHGALSSSEVRDKSASEIQEKIAENEGGMGPLSILTSAEIQAIANALRR